ncbi:MAG: hypothetical protein JJU41_01965 [Bacteroidetes bacterium]|nr:hypothetical protein [Bacteroidota bacterium]
MCFFFIGGAYAQESNFEQSWRPSIWYNTVDGAQLGVRYFGYLDDSTLDKYKVITGIWVNTALPTFPVAYDLRFEHPFFSQTSTLQPLILGVQSRFRDGLHRHGGFIEKRYHSGNHDDRFITFRMSSIYHRQQDSSYLVFPHNWNDKASTILTGTTYYRNNFKDRYFTAWASLTTSTTYNDAVLEAGSTLHHQINRLLAIGFKIGSRVHTGSDGYSALATNLAYQPAIHWHDNSWFRSHGTLPVAALRSGALVTTGSMSSIRGYSRHDAKRFTASDIHAIAALHGVSADVEIANPLDLYLRNIPVAGYFVHFKTRLFTDAAIVKYQENAQIITNNFIANAGAGILLYVNVPDVLARERGFALRWDIPFWLSDPLDSENPIKFRQQLSFDIIIPF